MQLPSQIYNVIEPVISYLNTHPIAHYSLIFVTFLLLATLILSLRQKTKTPATKKASSTRDDDIHFIAGDDVVSTQLDLAKAYIEMDRKKLAKKMLHDVIEQGSNLQQQQARQLLDAL
jgi:FimV-like protein